MKVRKLSTDYVDKAETDQPRKGTRSTKTTKRTKNVPDCRGQLDQVFLGFLCAFVLFVANVFNLRNLRIDRSPRRRQHNSLFRRAFDCSFGKRKRARRNVAPIVQLIFPVRTVRQAGLSERNTVLTLDPNR